MQTGDNTSQIIVNDTENTYLFCCREYVNGLGNTAVTPVR